MSSDKRSGGVQVIGLSLVQIYEFHDSEDGRTYYWNATEGRRLAERRKAETVSVYLADFGMTPEKVLEMCPDLDRDKALSLPPIALLSPVLFVPHRGKHVLVDGWHRMYLAAWFRIPCLPALILTDGEERSIRRGGVDGRGL